MFFLGRLVGCTKATKSSDFRGGAKYLISIPGRRREAQKRHKRDPWRHRRRDAQKRPGKGPEEAQQRPTEAQGGPGRPEKEKKRKKRREREEEKEAKTKKRREREEELVLSWAILEREEEH